MAENQRAGAEQLLQEGNKEQGTRNRGTDLTRLSFHVPRSSFLPRRRGIRLWGVDLVTARNIAQAAMALFLLHTGWQFYWFVRYFETGGASPYVARPAAVEGFLPLSALVALRSWLAGGAWDVVHPASVAIFLAILLSALLWKKGFCSWLCPIGALSEALGRLGQRAFGRNFALPELLDWLLRSVKYLLCFFFVNAIFFGMSGRAAAAFQQGAYNKIVDVKMLYFFTEPGLAAGIAVAIFALLSVLVANFWCRYLCPYGALLGLASLLSPFGIHRDAARCVDCGRCTRVCPNRIDVATAHSVRSPECTGCLNCVNACPRRGALDVALPGGRLRLHPWLFPALLLGSFVLVLAIAQLSGHWQTSLTTADYANLIPRARWLSH